MLQKRALRKGAIKSSHDDDEANLLNDGNSFAIERFIGKTKRVVLGADYVNTLENDIKPSGDPRVNIVVENYQRWIMIASFIFIVFHLAIWIPYLVLAIIHQINGNMFQVELYTFFTNSFRVDVAHSLGAYSLWYVLITMSFVAVIALIYMILGTGSVTDRVYRYYTSSSRNSSSEKEGLKTNEMEISQYSIEMLYVGVDWFMWLENAIVGGILLWVVGQYAGVTDILVLITLVILSFVISFAGGLGMEIANDGITAHTSRSAKPSKRLNEQDLVINWWPLVFGGVFPVLIVIVILIVFLAYAEDSTADSLVFQWLVIVLACLAYVVLLIVIFVRYLYAPLQYPDAILVRNTNDPEEVEKAKNRNKEETVRREAEFVEMNGMYKIAKLSVVESSRILIMIVFFVEIFF